MLAPCTIRRASDGFWMAIHDSPALGRVEVSGKSRADVLKKLVRELQYRLELCPCSGEVLGSVKLQPQEAADSETTS